MQRLKQALRQRRRSVSYEPIEGGSISSNGDSQSQLLKPMVSWPEYCIFVLLGVSMLWAWNMFLAAAPYFQSRFSKSDWLLTHFQPAILAVSTVTNLGVMLLLTKLQRNASYPARIITSLVLNFICFTLLALSTIFFRGITENTYFSFLMAMVFLSSLATGLCQNGLFAYASGFGVAEYTQAIMTGQGIAGVLPCVVQIVSVLSIPEKRKEELKQGAGQESPKSAFIYFLTATIISAISLIAFMYLSRQHLEHGRASAIKHVLTNGEDHDPGEEEEGEQEAVSEAPLGRKVIGLWALFLKLRYLSSAVFFTFTITMVYPVFTQAILSVKQPESTAPRLFYPASFIPLAFLVWNTGDLFGRMGPLIPAFDFTRHPRTVLLVSIARVGFVPLYLLCNIRGRGAIVQSDLFYLFVVQLWFGATNGFLGSTCMMGAPLQVEPEEREAAGGFMGLMLVGGLTAGSVLSFAAAKA